MSALKIYAAKLKDKDSLLNSSSGGAFTALSNVLLQRGDAIVCAVYDYTVNTPVFRIVSSQKQRDFARGTKYVQAEMGKIYQESVDWLLENPSRIIAFFGLGCQAAAFRQFMILAGLKDRVIIIDSVCHGAPSPKIWREYVKSVCGERTLTNVNMRNKKNGWNKSVGTVTVDETEVSIQDYRRLYSTRNISRPSCFACPYTRMTRSSDLTIGDYWHIEKTIPDFFDPMGVSLVLIHSEKGNELFEEAKQFLLFRESSEKECWQMNLEKPTSFPPSRDRFWKEYDKNGILHVVKKYGKTKPFLQRAKMKFTKVFYSYEI